MPYAFAHFIDPQYTRSAIERYRSEFRASKRLDLPRVIVALGAICAETEHEAEWLSMSARALLRRFRTFPRMAGLVPRPEDAVAELSTGLDPAVFDTGEWPRYAVGAPETVRGQLETMGGALGLDEFMIVTIVHDHKARLRSYELLAEACGG